MIFSAEIPSHLHPSAPAGNAVTPYLSWLFSPVDYMPHGILNLLMNAIEAMSGTGHIHRELSILSVKERSNAVLVEVRDSGPGLDVSASDRLFEAFYTTKADGTGMGLAISRTIIRVHGGRLWAAPNIPRGAIFTFELPAESKEMPLHE